MAFPSQSESSGLSSFSKNTINSKGRSYIANLKVKLSVKSTSGIVSLETNFKGKSSKKKMLAEFRSSTSFRIISQPSPIRMDNSTHVSSISTVC